MCIYIYIYICVYIYKHYITLYYTTPHTMLSYRTMLPHTYRTPRRGLCPGAHSRALEL